MHSHRLVIFSGTRAEPTSQYNQAHVHSRRYDVIHMLPFEPFSPLNVQTHFLTSS